MIQNINSSKIRIKLGKRKKQTKPDHLYAKAHAAVFPLAETTVYVTVNVGSLTMLLFLFG